LQDTSTLRPEILQLEDELLKGRRIVAGVHVI